MKKKLIIQILLVVLTITLIGLQAVGEYSFTFIVRAIGFPLLTMLYCIKTKDRKSYFFYFLLVFSVSEFFGTFIYMAYNSALVNDLMYYGRNSLYIAAYVFLLLKILKTINFKREYKRLSLPGLILLILSTYIVIYLFNITMNSEDFEVVKWYDYLLVLIYNAVIMVLLTTALLSYLCEDSKKRIILFFGVLFIVFSEIIQIASFYLVSQKILDIAHTVLIILGFSFLYFQFNLNYSEKEMPQNG